MKTFIQSSIRSAVFEFVFDAGIAEPTKCSDTVTASKGFRLVTSNIRPDINGKHCTSGFYHMLFACKDKKYSLFKSFDTNLIINKLY